VQPINDAWAQYHDGDDDDGGFDVIDLTQEVDNNGVGFADVGRISNAHYSVCSVVILTFIR
jgi:hypothetical protein